MKTKKPIEVSEPGYLLAVNFSAYKVVYYSLVFVCIVSLVNKPLSLSLSTSINTSNINAGYNQKIENTDHKSCRKILKSFPKGKIV